jgi:hypothetical protein
MRGKHRCEIMGVAPTNDRVTFGGIWFCRLNGGEPQVQRSALTH